MALVPNDDNLPEAALRAMLEEELRAWKQRKHQLRIQYKVRHTIGWNEESLAPFLTEMDQVERAIELVEGELGLLHTPQPLETVSEG